MAEIVEFPSVSDREWPKVAEIVREQIYKRGGDKQMADWIVADMEPRWRAMNQEMSVEVPSELAEAFREILRGFKEVSHQAVLQILVMEVDLYTAKFGPPAD